MKCSFHSVCVIGEGSLLPEITLCLLKAGHRVVEYCLKKETYNATVLAESKNFSYKSHYLLNISQLMELPEVDLVVVISAENGPEKRQLLRTIKDKTSKSTVIAINAESFSLNELREGLSEPERIIGLNWVQPAHLTLFLELIVMPDTPPALIDQMMHLAKTYWHKDPYVLYQGNSIRSRLMAAMMREAFFLIENGYVTEEDIDRACRNDAGYYLPFAGNLRYMDLMGTYVYGLVMEDLNGELDTNDQLPDFFLQLLGKHTNPGMAAGEGFYNYSPEQKVKLEESFLEFGKKIRALMDKFPFPRENPIEATGNMKESMAFPHKNRSL